MFTGGVRDFDPLVSSPSDGFNIETPISFSLPEVMDRYFFQEDPLSGIHKV